jgi:D-arabinose 1-dehydrogenase-like Zn-dependent alcohol dehydrogenase
MEVEGYRIHAWGGELQWESFEVPDPGPGEVLVRVEACGIGLTVLNWMRGDLGNDPALLPRVPGHEIVGWVETVGEGVLAPAPGDRVVAYVYLSCGYCQPCRSGQDSMCVNLGGYISVHCDGGYAPYVVLPARNLLPLPTSISATQAVAIPDAVVSPLHMVRTRGQVGFGDRVAIIGAGGGLGLHMVQIARLYGAEVAGLESNEQKLAVVEEVGGMPVHSAPIDKIDAGALWGGERPSVVIDLVGQPETLAWGFNALAPGGRMVLLTTFRDVDFAIDPREMVVRRLSILGSRYVTKAEIVEAAKLVEAGHVRPIVTQVVPPEGVQEVHRALQEGTLVGRGALLWTS